MHLLTLTGGILMSLWNSASASADELPGIGTRFELPSFSTDEASDLAELPLPARMKLQDEQDTKKLYDERRYSFDTPRQAPSERPLIDWKRIEPGIFTGFVYYGSAFRSNPEALLGVSLRLPFPGLPGRWAAFAEGFASYINRDLPFFYADQAGTWYGATLGGDYTLFESEVGYFRARGGILYADYNGIRELKNGMGILVGAEFGFFWVKHTDRFRLTIIPEYAFSGSDSMFLMTAGLYFYF
jgi:hypothetical protein